MEILTGALGWVAGLSAAVITMIGIFIIGLVLSRLSGVNSLRAAVQVSGAIVAMSALTSMFSTAMAPALTTVVESLGLQLDVIDLGVPSAYQILFGLPFYAILLVIGFAVNIVLIMVKFTDTLDVDVFNYSVFAISSAYTWAITGNIPLAIAMFIITEMIILKLADLTAPAIQRAYNLDGVSIPHGNAIVFAPVGIAVNWVIEKIPFLAKIDWSPETIEKRFGKAAQPWVIGFALGIVFGLVGGLGFDGSMMLAITTAAYMTIFPRVSASLIEGITPVAEGMRENFGKRFDRDLNIGLDAAILVGEPDVMATAILTIPFIMLLALVLPGNRVMPMADLAGAAPFLLSCCMPFVKKNIFRGLICGIIVFTIAFYACSATADWYTTVAALEGAPFESLSTSLGFGSTWLSAIIGHIVAFFA